MLSPFRLISCIIFALFTSISHAKPYPLVKLDSRAVSKQIAAELQQPFLTGLSCDDNLTQCLAFGEDFAHNKPFIYKTTNGAKTWQAVTLESNQNAQLVGRIVDISCHWDLGRCTAIGSNFGFGKPQAFSYQSDDEGNTWQLTELPINKELPADSVLMDSISCDKEHQKCLATGQIDASTKNVHLYQTNDGGRTWQATLIKLKKSIYDTHLDCDKSTQYCQLKGRHYQGLDTYQTTDFGAQWHRVSSEKNYESIKGTCNGANQPCYELIAKHHDNTEDYYIRISKDGGVNWQAENLIIANTNSVESGKPYYGVHDISCNKTLNNCITTGAKMIIAPITYQMSYQPLSFTSHDNGQTWIKNFPPLASNSKNTMFVNFQCDANLGNCIAITEDIGTMAEDPNEAFYLYTYQTEDGGQSWQELSQLPRL